MKYEQIFQHGHGWVDVKVCDQCDRLEHVDLHGYAAPEPLDSYWFCNLACLHDAQRGVIPRVSRRHDAKALRDAPAAAAESVAPVPAGVRWADLCVD